jgi:hypothetical protein
VSLSTVTAPHETPDTPDGVNVGGVPSQDVPEPVHVTTVTVLVLSTAGETESVDVTSAGSRIHSNGSPNVCVDGKL